jgi:hypothetical protein
MLRPRPDPRPGPRVRLPVRAGVKLAWVRQCEAISKLYILPTRKSHLAVPLARQSHLSPEHHTGAFLTAVRLHTLNQLQAAPLCWAD